MLEREAQRNVEVMWLTGKLAPDFPGLSARTGKTIANFRKVNRTAIQQVCRAFTSFCRDLDLFRRDLVAIDGSKFKAVNSRQRNFTDRKLQRALQEIDRKIEAYLDELDANDAEEPEEPKLSAEQLKEKIRLLKERMKEYKGLLSTMALRAKQAIGVDRLDVLTDMGYYDGQQVKTCLESGITPPTSPNPTPPPTPRWACMAKKTSATIPRTTATAALPENSSPSAGNPPRRDASAGTTPPLPAPAVPSNPNAPVAPRVAVSPAGPMRTCWKICSAGSGPALAR